MIIITENKKQHYLIKNFLKEIEYFSLNESLRSDQGGVHTALDIKPLSFDDTIVDQPKNNINDKEIITQSSPVNIEMLKKAAVKNPKMNKLIKLFKKGLLITTVVAATYFGMKDGDLRISNDIANDNKVAQEEVLNIMNSENEHIENDSEQISDEFINFEKNLKLSIEEKDINKARDEREYDGKKISRSSHHNSVYNFEGFSSKPYPDAGGTSIGYGIQLFKDANSKGGKTWQEVFFGSKLGMEIKGKGKNKYIVTKGKKVKLSKIKSITEAEGKLATDKDIPLRINLMHKVYSWSKELPRDVQLALLDMTYNMGMWFNMSGFKGNLKKSSECISDGDFEMAINYLNTAKQELKYFLTPENLSYEESSEALKYSGYAVQGDESVAVKDAEIHRRPLNSLQRIDDGIEVLTKHINKKTKNESYTIKSAYRHLFI